MSSSPLSSPPPSAPPARPGRSRPRFSPSAYSWGISRPIGASVTDNGVTLTVDAVIGDANSYAILYTLSRDDGTPLLQNVDPDANLYNIHFDEGWTITDPDSIELQEGEGLTFTGNNLLYTAFRPTDNAIHFFEEWHCPTLENMSGPARAFF